MIRFLIPLTAVLLLSACASVTSPDGWAPAAQVDDTLYVSLDRGELSALNADDYSEVWKFPEDDEVACGNETPKNRDLDGIYGAPAVDDQMLYIGAYDGAVYAVTRDEGVCEWRFKTDDPIVGAPILGDGVLYVPSTDGTLYVLDPETGDQAEEFAAGDIWSTPLLTDDSLFVTTMEGRLWRLDPDTLDPLWDFDTDAGLLTSPVLVEGTPGTVVAGGIGETLYARQAENGEEIWSFSAGNWFWGEVIAEGGRVYATSLDGKVYALDAATGEEAWSFDTDGPIRAGAALLGDDVVIVNNAGDAYGLNAETGDITWGPTELDESVYSQPIVQGDVVLVVTRNGDIITIDAEGRPTTVVN